MKSIKIFLGIVILLLGISLVSAHSGLEDEGDEHSCGAIEGSHEEMHKEMHGDNEVHERHWYNFFIWWH